MGRNIEQKRAHFAFEKLRSLGKEKAESIKTDSSKFIAQILNSGFLQAADFAQDKWKDTYGYLNEWFAKGNDEGLAFSEEVKNKALENKLTEALLSMDTMEYRRSMQEAMALLQWLKSKAEGRKMECEGTEQANKGEDQNTEIKE